MNFVLATLSMAHYCHPELPLLGETTLCSSSSRKLLLILSLKVCLGSSGLIEGNEWIVSLAGRFGDFPPGDDEGFLAFARALPNLGSGLC